MKTGIRNGLVGLGILTATLTHAQDTNIDWDSASDLQVELQAIEQVPPMPAIDATNGNTFYSAQHAPGTTDPWPPLPGDVPGLSTWDLGDGIYLLDDLGYHYHHRHKASSHSLSGLGAGMSMTADDSPVLPGDDDDTNPPEDSFPTLSGADPINTNLLWLQITNVANETAYLNLYNTTDYVYAVWSTTNLSTPFTDWDIETEVFPTNTNCMPFMVQTQNRQNLFLQAEDWTGVTSDGDTTPDWWFWEYYGTTDLSDTNLDSQGNTLLYDYEHHIDPNVISFFIVTTNAYVNTATPTLQLSGIVGIPDYEAVLVNDTNEADAVWEPYTGTNVVATLGADGNYNVGIGLRGLPANATETWQSVSLTKETALPVLTITNPASSTLSQGLVQIQGFANEGLGSLTFDVSNADGIITNQEGNLTGQFFDTSLVAYTTNYFESSEIDLADGTNIVTFHATDWAGNTTNLNLTLLRSSNPPALTITWPPPDTAISGSSFTIQGQVDDPSSSITATIVDSLDNTNTVQGVVEQNGTIWVQNLPLSSGTNTVTVTATDANGTTVTTFAVEENDVGLVINPLSSSQLNQSSVTVSGQIGNTNLCVWVNGTQATVNSDGTWEATNVPVSPTGTACLSVQVYVGDPTLEASQNLYQPQPVAVVLKSCSGMDHLTGTSYSGEKSGAYSPYDGGDMMNWAWDAKGNWTAYYTPPERTFELNIPPDGAGFATPWIADASTYFEPAWEYAKLNYVLENTANCQASIQTHVMLAPTGQTAGGLTNLYLVYACASDFSDHDSFSDGFGYGGYGDSGTFEGDLPMPPEWLQINGQTLIDTDVTNDEGLVWGATLISAPADDNVDVTPVATQVHQSLYWEYTFDVQATNVTLQIIDANTGNNLTGQTNTVIVGQQMNLLCELNITNALLTNSMLTNFSWTVPGDAISNYVVASDASSAYVATNFPTTNSTAMFYWVDGASNRTVQVSATVNGIGITGQAMFNIIKPSADWIGTITGDIAVDTNYVVTGSLPAGETWLHLGNSIDSNGALIQGITFTATNVNLNGYTGEYNSLFCVQIAANTQVERCYTNAISTHGTSYGLDTAYPYDTLNAALSSGSDAHAYDAPAMNCLPSNQQISDSDQFKMYLMFRATDVPSIPIPLKQINWNWSGSANNNPPWSLTSSNAMITVNDLDTIDLPQWNNNSTNLVYITNNICN